MAEEREPDPVVPPGGGEPRVEPVPGENGETDDDDVNGEAEVDTETDADEGDQPAEDGSEDEVIA